MAIRKMAKRHESGQSLIELALMMVFLLILLAGVVDVGRALFTYIAIRDGAQEGALVGSIDPGNGCTEITRRVQESSNFPVDMNDASIIIDCRLPASYCVGEEVGVSVSYTNFPMIMPFMGTLLGSQTVTITASITDTIVTNDPSITCP